MYTKRREFLKTSSLITTAFILGDQLKSIAAVSKKHSFLNDNFNSVPIYFTSDLNGQINSFNKGKESGLGGIENLNSFLNKQSPHVLVDGGNFLGNNISLEEQKNMISLMNKIGYQAVTVGNCELEKGLAHLSSLLPLMNFKVVNCNYEFTDPEIKSRLLPYHIAKFGMFKIGITGVASKLYNSDAGIIYHNPYKSVNSVATLLKDQMNCDLVICLSQLNFNEEDRNPFQSFAAASENIDIIISRTNKPSLKTNMIWKNKLQNQVVVCTTGNNGLLLGNVAFTFDENRKQHLFQCNNYIPGLPDGRNVYDEYKRLTA